MDKPLKMNRADARIAKRLARGDRMPTAYCPWGDADHEICGTLTTKPFDYTKRGQIVIFEHDERRKETDDSRILAGEEMEASEGGIRHRGAVPNPNR